MYLSHSFQDPDRNSARVTFQNDSKLDFEGAFFVHEMLLILCLKYISHFITFSVSVPTRMATFRIMLENHRNSLVTVSVGSRFIIKLEQLCFLQMVCLSLVTILNCYWAINWEQQNCVLLLFITEWGLTWSLAPLVSKWRDVIEVFVVITFPKGRNTSNSLS